MDLVLALLGQCKTILVWVTPCLVTWPCHRLWQPELVMVLLYSTLYWEANWLPVDLWFTGQWASSPVSCWSAAPAVDTALRSGANSWLTVVSDCNTGGSSKLKACHLGIITAALLKHGQVHWQGNRLDPGTHPELCGAFSSNPKQSYPKRS